MINIEKATVKRVLWSTDKIQCLEVLVGDQKETAINYPQLSGNAIPGNTVILNTTAVRLGLGSGGFHFVITNLDISPSYSPSGHIIKMRYTPLQFKLMTWEEKNLKSKYQNEKFAGLKVPVIIGELHSMILPVARTLKMINSNWKIAYVMNDSASLPLAFSRIVHQAKKEKILDGTITAGQAFGGDLETVNIYTALIAAREEFAADIVLLMPGPGVVGTGTRYGFSGIEQGEHVERVHKLGGIPLVIPRISFADPRSRHRGISHHTLTALGELTTRQCHLPLPACNREKIFLFYRQLSHAGILEKHKVVVVSKHCYFKYFKKACHDCYTMGRKAEQDPIFFAAVVASACFVAKFIYS